MTLDSLSVLRGTLELLALRTLSGGGALHGFEILDCIRDSTGGALHVEEGALYPALHRMEKRGWLKAEWGISPKGRRAKYYRLNRVGKRALAQEERNWQRYVAAVAQVAGPAADPKRA